MSAAGEEGGAGLAWRQLLRIGNVFTAASNVIAGFLIAHGEWGPAGVLAALVASSACLYAAGMVLNDAFDAHLDARERPERPIPSGRILRRTAFLAGWTLVAWGLVWSALASVVSEYAAPVTVASCLALTIVMYDGGLKSTWAGPWAMGWCRTLNVLLGASASPRIEGAAAIWGYALVIGAYTVALTLLARRETGDDVARAMNIRGCVKRMILGFIVIDACAATFAAGWMSGVAVLLLLVPTLVAARQAPMT